MCYFPEWLQFLMRRLTVNIHVKQQFITVTLKDAYMDFFNIVSRPTHWRPLTHVPVLCTVCLGSKKPVLLFCLQRQEQAQSFKKRLSISVDCLCVVEKFQNTDAYLLDCHLRSFLRTVSSTGQICSFPTAISAMMTVWQPACVIGCHTYQQDIDWPLHFLSLYICRDLEWILSTYRGRGAERQKGCV